MAIVVVFKWIHMNGKECNRASVDTLIPSKWLDSKPYWQSY